MVGNFVQRLIPHMGRNRAIVAALDQATWGIPAFVGLTGFNFEGFFSYLIKTIKDYPGPYTERVNLFQPQNQLLSSIKEKPEFIEQENKNVI